MTRDNVIVASAQRMRFLDGGTASSTSMLFTLFPEGACSRSSYSTWQLDALSSSPYKSKSWLIFTLLGNSFKEIRIL